MIFHLNKRLPRPPKTVVIESSHRRVMAPFVPTQSYELKMKPLIEVDGQEVVRSNSNATYVEALRNASQRKHAQKWMGQIQRVELWKTYTACRHPRKVNNLSHIVFCQLLRYHVSAAS